MNKKILAEGDVTKRELEALLILLEGATEGIEHEGVCIFSSQEIAQLHLKLSSLEDLADSELTREEKQRELEMLFLTQGEC